MGATLIIHDRRLKGVPDPRTADRVITVGGSTPIRDTITRAREFAMGGTQALELIAVMCHGYERIHESETYQECVQVGGFGLQLCREGVNFTTVGRFASLEGTVREIVVYACSAADAHPDFVGQSGDGRRLFGELSLYTGAVVFAADATQWYRIRTRALPNQCTQHIDFGDWEGNLWRFTPDGRPPTVVKTNPLTVQ